MRKLNKCKSGLQTSHIYMVYANFKIYQGWEASNGMFILSFWKTGHLAPLLYPTTSLVVLLYKQRNDQIVLSSEIWIWQTERFGILQQ